MREIPGHGSDRRPPGPGSRRPDTNGHRHANAPGTPYDALAAERMDDDGVPVDLVELQADDELINALSSRIGVGGAGQQEYSTDDRLVAMLASWRADVESTPFPQLVEPDVAAQVLAPRRSRKISYLRPLVAAVAVAACGLGVLTVTAHDAQPGDPLWGLSRVLYSERAERVQAVADLSTGVEQVNAKLATGDTAGARQDLAAMGPLLEKVEPGEDKAFFDKQNDFLAAKVAETPPGTPTDPSAPLRDGTKAPPREPVDEGTQQRDRDRQRGSESPSSPQDPQSPTSAGGTSGGGTSGSAPGSHDPRRAPAPQGTSPGAESKPQSPTPTQPSGDPTPTSPTTEGTADPTTRPTASGPTETPEPQPGTTTR